MNSNDVVVYLEDNYERIYGIAIKSREFEELLNNIAMVLMNEGRE